MATFRGSIIEKVESPSPGQSESPPWKQPDYPNFLPLVILEFATGTNQAAREWLTAKIEASRHHRGAELQVRTNYVEHSKTTILYISASTERLLIGAEEMKIMKPDIDGVMRELSLADIDAFLNSDDLDDFLTMSEKQRVIMKGIESLRATDDEPNIPGYPKHTLYCGKSIIKRYLSRGLVSNIFPLHNVDSIKELGSEWYSLKSMFKKQPIDKIQEYFGSKIALYFSFLGFYTVSLIPPALIGIIYFIFSGQGSMYREAVFSVFNLIWTTLFLEGWKRYCSTLSFKWGTMDSASRYAYTYEEPRADYKGKMGINQVTGQPEPQYAKYKRVLKLYLVTVPIMSFWLTIAFFCMLAYFWAEDWMKVNGIKNMGLVTTFSNLLPTIGYAIVIGILNGIYRTVAVKLNKFENHRLQSSYDNHLTVKLILFEFINCFICLFYVAFYMQDRTLLKTFLGTLLVTQQVVGQFQESIIPFLFVKRRQKQVDTAVAAAAKESEENDDNDVDGYYKKQTALESRLEGYRGSNDEYLEMYIQFGYVYLFSSVFPLAALWALLNNMIEIRSDAFKLCRVHQRPFAESANNIGAWQAAFEIIGLISVITNCALIGLDPNIQKLLPSNMSAVNMVIIFVVAEHIVLAIKASVAFLIPDLPKWVVMEMAKQEYVAKLALRKQRLADASQKKKMVKEALMRRQPSKEFREPQADGSPSL